ncbi:MAG: hypothetical protein HUU38_22940 [Anaerolineales bacterium]|jgi:hypothetical protein|nr:hypothetical protein [Anaerolineales bacterium]
MQAINPSRVNVNGGYICLWSHWKAAPLTEEGTEPETPGTKAELQTYMPQDSDESCMCGSEKPYEECCKKEQYWWPLCPDPELEGYSLVAPQSVTFRQIDGAALRKRLMEDDRLVFTDNSENQETWSYWGETLIETPGHGIVEYGELALKHNHTLLVTVASDEQRHVLLHFLKEIAGDLLSKPVHKYAPLQVFDKRTNKTQTLPPLQWLKRPVGQTE